MKPIIIRRTNLQTFNEISEEYDHRRRSPWNECVTPLSELGANPLILDVGAGTGRQTLAIAQRGCDVVAVDFSASMLVKLKKNAADLRLDSEISLVVSDITTLPFRDLVFEGIEMVAALHNVPSMQLRISAMKETYRVTRVGGRAVITVWLRFQRGFYRLLLSSGFRCLLRESDWGDVWIPWGDRPRFYHLFSQRELRSVVSKSGFHINEIQVATFGQEGDKRLNRNILLKANKI